MCKILRSFFFLIHLYLTAAISVGSGRPATQIDYPQVPQARMLSTPGRHYPGIARAFTTAGFQVREISPEVYKTLPLAGPALLIVPEREAQQLEPTMVQMILHGMERGLPLLLDGSSPLAAALGIKATSAHGEVTRYRWERYADSPIRLPGGLSYPQFELSAGLHILASDAKRKAPLVVSGSRGQGTFSSTPPSPLNRRKGWSSNTCRFWRKRSSMICTWRLRSQRTISVSISTLATIRKSMRKRLWRS